MKRVQNRRRPRNQRFSNRRQRRQQHLLDVKVRSRSAVQHRNRRILVFISKIALLAAVCVGIYIGARKGLDRFFFKNPDYRLTMIDTQTDGTLQREQILEIAEVHEGVNIFQVNLGRMHDRLQQLAQVDDVQVIRKLPGEIDIKITERKPIAWITSEKQMADPFASDVAFLIDARGVLMKEKKLLPEYLGLPLISGCTSESLEPGKVVDSSEAKAALELLRLSTRSFMQTRFQIRDIDLSKGYCLLVTDKNHSRVTFAFENIDTQLQRLEKFLVYCDDTKQELATANLMVQRNIPVTFGKSPVDVINDSIDPHETPQVMKAVPAHETASQFGTFSATKPKSKPSSKPSASAAPARRAIPVTQSKKEKSGGQ
jgi:cell division septal protein FtsQ